MTLRLLFLASVAVVSLGCGFTTHDTIATRAVNYFFTPSAYGDKYTRLLAANGDAIQGGAPFPDYLYTYVHLSRGFHVISY